MNLLAKISLFALANTFALLGANAQCFKPDNYRVATGCLTCKTDCLISIREFNQSGKHYYVALSPRSLTLKVVLDSAVVFEPMDWNRLRHTFKHSNYIQGIASAEDNSTASQNAGITHFNKIEDGIVLSVDLCPSKLPLDKEFVLKLIGLYTTKDNPLPITISVSGLWIKQHPKDFNWLINQRNEGKIQITWINHSYYHRYTQNVPWKENFLLQSNTSIEEEILLTEKLLLSYGELPSPFFRFPGLISSKTVFEKVTSYGLIPIGADAWLAKNQQPSAGSIVLVHANGNEPIGLKKFDEIHLRSHNILVVKGWFDYDLHSCFTQSTLKSGIGDDSFGTYLKAL